MSTASRSGSLFFQGKRSDFWRAVSESRVIRELRGVIPGWTEFTARPTRPWLPSEVELNLPGFTPKYRFWARKGSNRRFLLLSTSSKLVDRLLIELMLHNQVLSPIVDVQRLVSHLAISPRTTAYSLGAVWAKIEGHGQSFRRVALFGDDLAAADTFTRELLPKISPFRVALRRPSGNEVLSIGSRGEVSFTYTNLSSYREVDEALRKIGELGFLDWVPEGWQWER